MPTKDRKFPLKDYEELIGTKLVDYIQTMKLSIHRQSAIDDLGPLEEAQGNGRQEVPPGYHRMPETGELMRNEDMIGQ